MLLRCLLVVLMMLVEGFGHPAQAAPQRLVTAKIIQSDGTPDPPGDAASYRLVELPLLRGGWTNDASSRSHWVEIDFPLKDQPSEPWALSLYASARPVLYVNGSRLSESPTDPTPRSDPRFVPLLFDVPAALLHRGDNRLLLRIDPTPGGLTLSPLTIGPEAVLVPWYRRELWVNSTGLKVAKLAIAGIGHFFLVMWFRRGRRDRLYGIFASSCAMWIALIMPFVLLTSDEVVFHLPRWLAMLSILHSAFFVLMALELLDLATRRVRQWLAATGLGLALAALLLPTTLRPLLPAAGLTLCLTAEFATVLLAAAVTIRRRSTVAAILLASSMIAFVTLAADGLQALGLRAWPGPRLSSYGMMIHALLIGGWLVSRLIRAGQAHERLKRELEEQAAQSEAALAASYATAAALDRKFAAAAERDRFLAEVHQGLGSYLEQSMDLARSGQLTPLAAESLLNGAMNELRISIESSRPGGHDLLMMLGNLRYRLQSRLKRAGISLEWDIQGDLPPEGLPTSAVADLTRIVYEAFSNSIRHSAATTLRLQVRLEEAATVCVSIVDNGRGFDVASRSPGRGLRNIRRLAERAGAGLQMVSRPGETRISLAWQGAGA